MTAVEEEEKSGNVSQQFDDLKYEASDFISCEHPSHSVKGVKLSSETAREVGMHQNGDGPNMEVLVSDLTCVICNHLLFRPVVLNCGDVYCEACIFNSSDAICKCPVCQTPHPNGFANVCWVLEHFLEWQFPEEYAVRRESSLEHVRPSRGSNKPAHSSSSGNAYSSWLAGQGPVVIIVGCVRSLGNVTDAKTARKKCHLTYVKDAITAPASSPVDLTSSTQKITNLK